MSVVLRRLRAFRLKRLSLPRSLVLPCSPLLGLREMSTCTREAFLLRIPVVEMGMSGLLMSMYQNTTRKGRLYIFRLVALGIRSEPSVQLLSHGTSSTSCSISRSIPELLPELPIWPSTRARMPESSRSSLTLMENESDCSLNPSLT
mmetsp:Transcript_37871/g.120736  ORF Transcript_37871/g.120736 Transcript_37871/m.120736 type:complete len:147 (-) Transcript_37871:881-1321(-)